MGRWKTVLFVAGLILFTPLIAIVTLVLNFPWKPMRRKPGEVARLLRRRIAGDQGDAEWDEFVCVKIADPRLERIRDECGTIDMMEASDNAPIYLTTAGLERMQALLEQCESLEKADAAGSGCPEPAAK